MRKYIIISFTIIFLLFGIGSGVTIYHLVNTTANLRQLISLHEIEDIRQDLSFSLQKIQNYAFSSPAYFAQHLDEVIDNANIVNRTVLKCYDCHHEPAVEAELHEIESLIEEYQEQLSFLITSATETERRRIHQLNVFDQSNIILNQVQGMVSRAAKTLNIKTGIAMRKIDNSYIILGVTLFLTFVTALIVAQHLAGRITKPVKELLTATNEIAQGKLGYQAEFSAQDEFRTLISTFNNMSGSLARQEEKIQNTMEKLSQLHHMTLPLHSAHEMALLKNHMRTSMKALVDAEHTGFMLPDDEYEDRYSLYLYDGDSNSTGESGLKLSLSRSEVLNMYNEQQGQPILDNTLEKGCWPFSAMSEGARADNLLVVWMLVKNDVNGALVAINKKGSGFTEEDTRFVGLLANNTSVALENIGLLNDLESQMTELKNTQRQLIEAEKLTALGTLAGGVAHDFNNILCGMIGYVALLKMNQDKESKDFKMLDTIEKAGFRAANLTKQLLTFSRQEALDHKPIEVNQHIENIAKMLENTISKLITIKLELGDVPPVQSDPAQLEQVVMNLCVNARDAMPNGGELLIRSEQASVDREFCKQHPEAKLGKYIKLTVSDQGEGIDKEILPRIFEPFFTTKEMGKGTGLGLAMVYGIVKNHKGFIIVSSSPEKGTTFSVYLPAADFIKSEEIQPSVTSRSLHAGVMIVDDEELVASMLAEHLQNLGCKTFHASNGAEALSLFNQHSGEVDVVILDINMPLMDGKTTYEKMAEIRPDIKVLVASGYTLDCVVDEILKKGAHGFIQKPYSLDNIAAKIREIIA